MVVVLYTYMVFRFAVSNNVCPAAFELVATIRKRGAGMLIRFGKRAMSVCQALLVLIAISGVTFVSYTKAFSAAGQGMVSDSSEASAQDSIVRIVGHATADEWALSFLEELTDLVGPRVTGSQQSKEASQLVLKALTGMGFESAHLEEYSFHPLGSAGLQWQE